MPGNDLRYWVSHGTVCTVGDDGKIKLRNPDQIRPFLPQIQGFLKGLGGTDKLKELSKKSPEERKAAMVSNLLVVLCGEAEVHPVVNTGTLYN